MVDLMWCLLWFYGGSKVVSITVQWWLLLWSHRFPCHHPPMSYCLFCYLLALSICVPLARGWLCACFQVVGCLCACGWFYVSRWLDVCVHVVGCIFPGGWMFLCMKMYVCVHVVGYVFLDAWLYVSG